MSDSPATAADAAPTKPVTPSTPRNPYAVGLWVLAGAMFLTAFILQRVGPENSWIADGSVEIQSFTFDPLVLFSYNIAAFVFLVLGVLCLLATLHFHASRWKPAVS